jgi:hypothetical protein
MGPSDPNQRKKQYQENLNRDFAEWSQSNDEYLKDASQNPGFINSIPRRAYNTWQNVMDLGLSERRLLQDSEKRKQTLEDEYQRATEQGPAYRPSDTWLRLKRNPY